MKKFTGGKHIKIRLKKRQREYLRKIISKGVSGVKRVRRAQMLLHFDSGKTVGQAAEAVGAGYRTALRLRKRFLTEAMERALNDAPRPGVPALLNRKQSQQIIAVACSPAPLGRSRWTVRLLAEEVVRKGIIPKVGRETIRVLLKDHDLKPWREKNVVHSRTHERVVRKMEDVLDTYEKPLDPKEPVICLDERPVQLLGDARNPILVTKPGEIFKRDSEYIRKGTANVFCAVEPKAGKHITKATKNRKAPQFARIVKTITKKYPRAKTIHLVMDNLNTHKQKSLINYYGKKVGEKIWGRLTPHYTPTHGSWLNQAEIEIGIMSRQCLGKDRIPDLPNLKKRVNAWNRRTNRKGTTIDWQFTKKKARRKFKYTCATSLRSEY